MKGRKKTIIEKMWSLCSLVYVNGRFLLSWKPGRLITITNHKTASQSVSLLWFLLFSVFSVRVSVTFHLTCVHLSFSSIWVAEMPPFLEIAAHSVAHMFSLYVDYL